MTTRRITSILLSFILILSLFAPSVSANDTDAFPKDETSTAIASASEYLLDITESDGLSFGYEWYVISLIRAGKEINPTILDSYRASLLEAVAGWDENTKPTEIERAALALSVMGKDITNVDGKNLAALICNNPALSGGSNESAYALIALDARDTEIPDGALFDRDGIIGNILSFQTSEGSFGIYDNVTGNVDMTALCLQALAPYRENADVSSAVEAALSFLASSISPDFTCGDNPDTTAAIFHALTTLGIDGADPEYGFASSDGSIVTALEKYRNPVGTGYLRGDVVNPMTTVSVLMAYDAYRKEFLEGVSYWDFLTEGEKYDDTLPEITPDDEPEEASPADIFVTIASEGKVTERRDGGYMALAPVTVCDINKNGTLSVNEALIAAHDAYFTDGASGYATCSGAYGESISVLWGIGQADVSLASGYWLNDVSCMGLGDAVAEGDRLTAFIYNDTMYWSDAYSYFTESKITAESGEKITLTLLSLSGYDAENGYAPIFSPCADADVSIPGTSVASKTSEDGTVTLTLPAVSKTTTYSVVAGKDDASIVPAVCAVTISPKSGGSGSGGSTGTKTIRAYIRVSDPKGKTYYGKKQLTVNKGTTAYELLLKTGLNVETTKNSYGVYVSGIEGLSEFDEGNESGWMFRVNSSFPSVSISSYVLSDGDYVELLYTRNMGADIGDTGRGTGLTSGGTKTVTYTVTFNSNGGSSVTAKTVAENGCVTKPTDPTRDGHSFSGWFTDSALSAPYDFDLPVTKNITLYAKWEESTTSVSFDDVDSSAWYYDPVRYVSERGIMQGDGKSFNPADKMTRAMLATVLYRLCGDTTSYTNTFTDVPEASWYAPAVSWAQSVSVVNGVSADRFSPDEAITREQMATILYRYANYKKLDTEEKKSISHFSDSDDVRDWARDGISWAHSVGIINGTSDTTLSPKSNATRAEVATILMRFAEQVQK